MLGTAVSPLTSPYTQVSGSVAAPAALPSEHWCWKPHIVSIFAHVLWGIRPWWMPLCALSLAPYTVLDIRLWTSYPISAKQKQNPKLTVSQVRLYRTLSVHSPSKLVSSQPFWALQHHIVHTATYKELTVPCL